MTNLKIITSRNTYLDLKRKSQSSALDTNSNHTSSSTSSLSYTNNSNNAFIKRAPTLFLPSLNSANLSFPNNKLPPLKRSSSEAYVSYNYRKILKKDQEIIQEELNRLQNLIKLRSSRDLSSSMSENNKENLMLNAKIKQYVKNNNQIKIYDQVPRHLMPPLHITNQDEARKSFLEEKIPPVLKFKANEIYIAGLMSNKNKASYEHFFKAKNILDSIKKKFPKGVYSYYEAKFGRRLKNSNECVELVGNYLSENRVDGELSINFAPGLTCAGRIYHHSMQNNRPETRKFVVWISNDIDNQFLREKGLICLCDHEIGTHFYRSYNDGLQAWFADRKKYGLRSADTNELMRTEEGLAALHTLINANLKYLYLPALFYCKFNYIDFFTT